MSQCWLELQPLITSSCLAVLPSSPPGVNQFCRVTGVPVLLLGSCCFTAQICFQVTVPRSASCLQMDRPGSAVTLANHCAYCWGTGAQPSEQDTMSPFHVAWQGPSPRPTSPPRFSQHASTSVCSAITGNPIPLPQLLKSFWEGPHLSLLFIVYQSLGSQPRTGMRTGWQRQSGRSRMWSSQAQTSSSGHALRLNRCSHCK